MRILIVASQRTGGFNLMQWISKELNLKYVHEPQRIYYPIEDNIVVKELVWDGIMYEQYDKIITIRRLDERAVAESMIYALKKDEWRGKWEVSDEWIREREEEIKIQQKIVRECNHRVERIKEKGLSLTYEGVYERGDEIPMLIEYLNIENPKFLTILSKDNRYRNIEQK